MGILNDLYLSRKPLAGFTVIGMAWAAYFAQMPVIKAGLSVSDATYGLIVLVSSLGAVAAMFLAPLTQRLAGSFALVFAALAIAAGFIWVGVASNAIMIALDATPTQMKPAAIARAAKTKANDPARRWVSGARNIAATAPSDETKTIKP